MIRTLFIATLMCLAATASQAGSAEIPDEVNARLARIKTQAAAVAQTRGRVAAGQDGASAIGTGAATGAAGALGNGCNIAIGNVFEDKGRIGTSARRETTVIVTGDVIQVGNNCR